MHIWSADHILKPLPLTVYSAYLSKNWVNIVYLELFKQKHKIKWTNELNHSKIHSLVGLELNSPVNTIQVMLSSSVYQTTLFLGRLSPLVANQCLCKLFCQKLTTVLLHIKSTVWQVRVAKTPINLCGKSPDTGFVPMDKVRLNVCSSVPSICSTTKPPLYIYSASPIPRTACLIHKNTGKLMKQTKCQDCVTGACPVKVI